MRLVLERLWGRLWLRGWIVMGCLIAAPPGAVNAADSELFAVQSANMHRVGDVYRLSAVLELKLPGHVVEAIENGLTVTLLTVMEVQRRRWYWWNSTVARSERRSQLAYHALSQQYLVRDLASGRQRGYLTLQEAVADLSVLLDYPVLDAGAVDPNRRYQVRMRVQLDRMALPAVLRTEALLDSRWKLASDWYEWDLTL